MLAHNPYQFILSKDAWEQIAKMVKSDACENDETEDTHYSGPMIKYRTCKDCMAGMIAKHKKKHAAQKMH